MTDETKAIKPYEKIKTLMRSDDVMLRFREILGNTGASAYVSSVLIAVANNDKLQECTPGSIMVSAMRAATLHLSCDPITNEAHLVPYGNKATFIAGYKGLYKMAIRTNKYRHLNVGQVYEGEVIVEDRMRGIHRLEGGRTGEKIVGWLFYMELFNGFCKSMYMTVEEIHAHAKLYSKSYDKPSGPWKSHTQEMERKTVLRLGINRYGYLDPADLAVLNVIDEEPTNGEAEAIDARFRDPDKPRSQDEILRELGYDVDLDTGEVVPEEPIVPEPEPEPENSLMPEMTLEVAKDMLDKNGVKYGDIPANELRYHLRGIKTALARKDLEPEQRITYERKEKAINLILQASQGE